MHQKTSEKIPLSASSAPSWTLPAREDSHSRRSQDFSDGFSPGAPAPAPKAGDPAATEQKDRSPIARANACFRLNEASN